MPGAQFVQALVNRDFLTLARFILFSRNEAINIITEAIASKPSTHRCKRELQLGLNHGVQSAQCLF